MKYFLIILIAIVSLTFLSKHAGSPDDYKNLAIASENKFKFTDPRHKKVHCQDAVDWQICFDAYSAEGKDRDLIIWLGNSQLHTINNFVPGHSPSSYLLHTELAKNKIWLITLSQPNANLIEHLLILCHLKDKYPIKAVLLSLVFDDFRESGIRPSLSKLVKDPQLELCFERMLGFDGLALLKLARPAEKINISQKEATLENDSEYLHDVEHHLNVAVSGALPFWEKRGALRSLLFSKLYHLRNWVFGITPSTKRRVIKSRYQTNMLAYEAITNLARDSGWSLTSYIAPLRNDGETPYVESEYALFKRDLVKYPAKVVNLENLIPINFWDEETVEGQSSQIDFMHFQFEGHKLLSDKLRTIIISTDD